MVTPEHTRQLISSPHSKDLVLTAELTNVLPGYDSAAELTDEAYLDSPKDYLTWVYSTVNTLESEHGAKVPYSLMYEEGVDKTDEVLVIYAPFSDIAPLRDPDTMFDYTVNADETGFLKKERIKPGSMNQATKSAMTYQMLKNLGYNIPVVTIYGPVPSHAFGFKDRSKMRHGDFTPNGKLLTEVLNEVQAKINGDSKDDKITKLHGSGVSLGASHVIGAMASSEIDSDYNVKTVTANELIMGITNLPDLANRFILKSAIGEPSTENRSTIDQHVNEFAMRRQIDGKGAEPIGNNLRPIKGMKPTYMIGLLRSDPTKKAIDKILGSNTSFVVALSENSSMSEKTKLHLPKEIGFVIMMRATNGNRLGHLSGEHVHLNVAPVAQNILRPKTR
jgi:hypothetical protein